MVGSIWNIEMSSLVGFKTKRNFPWPSMARRPPSNRSLKGELSNRFSDPVWLTLANPGTEEGEGEPGAEA